jgi:hypothetical protein
MREKNQRSAARARILNRKNLSELESEILEEDESRQFPVRLNMLKL